MSRYAPAARPFVQCLRATGSGRGDHAVAAARQTGAITASAMSAATGTTLAPPAHQFAVASSAASSAHIFRATFATSARQYMPLSSSTTASSSSTQLPPLEELEGWELDPNVTTLPWAEKELMRRGTPPVGSRRRRAAIHAATTAGADPDAGPVPFELMPYQCFQEARKLLKADRDEKLRQIATESAKIRKLEEVEATGTYTSRGGAAYVQRRLASLRAHLEHLKILADINDPLVKRRFEDGLGDMNKPIYRYLAEQRWRGRPLRLIQQRINQFYLAPDLLPPSQLQPTADVELFFRSYKVAPGAIVDSLISEVCPRLRVQVFDRGERLVSVLVVDADVPDLANDNYTRRCHYLATNIPVSPTDPSVVLSRLDESSQVVLPWLPAFAQKGSAPHRLAVFVLEQGDNKATDAAALRQMFTATTDDAAASTATSHRDGFSVRNFVNKHNLKVVGCNLFRTEWDAGTAGVMERAGVPGADMELKATRLPSLKPPRKARGWEAKHQGPKYRHLWKYTHRIATPKRKFVR